MSELRTKARKTHYFLKHTVFTFQNTILLAIAVFCLLWTWGSITALSRNWSLAQELMERQREKIRLELEVETLELENEYYLSNEYQELAARRYQGKKLPGETMVYLPENSVAAKSKHQDTADTNSAVSINEMSTFDQWLAFLFGA